MNFRLLSASTLLLSILLLFPVIPLHAEPFSSPLEQSVSETLDLWREGRFDQLYERLTRRGRTSKEQFTTKMRETTIRPACCWQKMQNFRIINEKRTEAVVYAKIGLEGASSPSASSTREFKLTHEEGTWKMQLADITKLAGATGKKAKKTYRKSKNRQNNS